jgi:hypothetical protein
MALAKMPPLYRDVFFANQAGATVEEIMQRFPKARSPKAVANILRDAGMRVQASNMAAQGTLEPKTKDGMFDGGRPDLTWPKGPTPPGTGREPGIHPLCVRAMITDRLTLHKS